MPTPHVRRVFAVTTAALLGVGRALADAPVPPEPLVVDAGLEPASLTTPAPPPPASGAPVPLGPRPVAAAPSGPPRPAADWWLLVPLGAAFAVLAGHRLFMSRRASTLPPDVFEVLGEASLGGQQAARIVRFGPRTLLVGVSAAGCQTLAELVDPQATEAIVAACRNGRGTPGGDLRPGRREGRG